MAGVENVFDCTQGQKIVLEYSKILANKNYHLTGTEEWGSDLIKKDPIIFLNMYTEILISTTQDPPDDYVKDPNCWPDGRNQR